MKIFIVAGEPSGDTIGAEIISCLDKQKVNLYGIGGSKMLQAGLPESLFPIKQISIMGFFEVLPKAFKVLKLLNKTIKYILKIKPDYIITIDAPGFNTRLIAQIRKKGFKGKVYHAVAPSVWAYNPNRAKKFSQLFDKLFCILPFEPPYFLKEGLSAEYICYPPFFRLLPFLYRIQTPEKYFILNLGSRESEIKRNIPLISQIIKLIKASIPDVIFIIPSLLSFKELLCSSFPNEIIVTEESEKIKYLQRSAFCISKSGTGAMENAFFGTPSVVFYKGNPLSFLIAKILVKIKFVTLINIILKKEIIPEFLQNNATPEKISKKVLEIYFSKLEQEKQQNGIEEVKDILFQGAKYHSFGEGIANNLR